MIGLGPLAPLPYPIKLGGKPVYPGLGVCKGGPGRYRLIPVPIYILTQIFNILTDTSVGFEPGFDLSH